MIIGLTLLLTRISKLGLAIFFFCLALGKLAPLIWQHDAYTYKWLSLVYFFAVLGLILPQFYLAKNPVFGQKDQ